MGSSCPRLKAARTSSQLAHRTGNIPIHAIVTETPASLFGLLSYRGPLKSPLVAMSWGAEDLSAALGASSKYDAARVVGDAYGLARSLCAWPGGRGRLQPVDGVFADFRDEKGLIEEAEGLGAGGLHRQARDPPWLRSPRSTPPSPPRLVKSSTLATIVEAFDAEPNAGVLSVGGRMVDRPHLVQARRVLDRAS